MTARAILASVGIALLLAGAWRHAGSRRRALQGRIWLVTGAVFCVVAVALHWR